MLRIRDNAEVKEIHISNDQIAQIKKITSSYRTPSYKASLIRRVTGKSPCCICGGIPSMEVRYPMDDVVRVESYCEQCIKSVFERISLEPKSAELVAEYYGCVKSCFIP